MENLFTYAVENNEIPHSAIDPNTDCKEYCYPDIRIPAGYPRRRFWLCGCGCEWSDKELMDISDDNTLHYTLQTTGGLR